LKRRSVSRARGIGLLGALCLFASPLSSIACGACDEDSIAATYDHSVVEQAAEAHDLIVYCQLGAPVDEHRLLSAARRIRGLKAQSIRISREPAAVSFAVDPRRQSALTAVAALLHGLPTGSHAKILKVVTAQQQATQ
jgi:hypothetical protein